MKRNISRVMAAIVFGVLLCGHAQSQTKFSPRYGIAYDAQGWDEASDQYIAKRAAKVERKEGAAVSADFRFQMERLRHFGEWIDQKWSERVQAWGRCHYVGDVDPRRFFVTVEGDTFTLPQYPDLSQVWGTVDTSAKRIRVTAWAYIKNRGWIVNAIDTWAWEAGNALMLLKIGFPKTVASEIGDGDPCKK
jgi:hypothetical protein